MAARTPLPTVTGTITIAVGANPAVEVATFEVPVTCEIEGREAVTRIDTEALGPLLEGLAVTITNAIDGDQPTTDIE